MERHTGGETLGLKDKVAKHRRSRNTRVEIHKGGDALELKDKVVKHRRSRNTRVD